MLKNSMQVLDQLKTSTPNTPLPEPIRAGLIKKKPHYLAPIHNVKKKSTVEIQIEKQTIRVRHSYQHAARPRKPLQEDSLSQISQDIHRLFRI